MRVGLEALTGASEVTRAWLLGLVAFNVGGLIHFLLVLAIISVIVHFLTGGRTRVV